MEVKHNVDNLTAHINIHIDEADYREDVDKQLKDYRRKASMPGFRPGHVPAGMIKKMYGEAVMADTISKKLGEELDKYIKDNGFKTLGQPLPVDEEENRVDFKTMTTFDFKYEIGLKPDFDIDIDDKIKLDLYTIEVGDDAVDKYLTDIRRRLGKQTEVDSPSEGDVVYGDMKEVDGELQKENVAIGIDYIKLKGVKGDFLKLKKGDSLTFNPARAFKNHVELSQMLGIGLEEAKNFKSDMEFTLKDIRHFELAEVNQELFDKVYENQNISSEEELRERILTDVTQTYLQEGKNQFMNDIVDYLVEKTNLELPDAFLKRWIIESNSREEEDKQISPAELEVQYDSYRDTLRWQIIEEKLQDKYGISVGMEEIKGKIAELMGLQVMGGENDEQTQAIIDQVAQSVMQNQEEVNKIASQISEAKIQDLFKEKTSIKEKTISYEDFVKMVSEKNMAKAGK
jgi:trigger factor